ncbi:MAG: DUF177 domain-containing protein [Lachnospiraceae bacterium]|nr:DUF177 domain-containing protein [Lachnospiraceae bacterium]
MLVNLTDVFTNEGQVQELEVPYDADAFTNHFGTFQIREKSPVALRLSNIGRSKALIQGNARFTFALACDRCLRDVDYTFDLSFDRVVVSPEYTDGGMECKDSVDDEDSSELMEGYHLNVDELIKNELLLNWPLKVLCREDCRGICKTCGRNLNDGGCGCDDFVPDPRMAAIKDLFNANKEV